MNQYVTELDNFLDIRLFQEIANNLITDEWLGLPDPIALGQFTDRQLVSVYDYEYLAAIKEKYPKFNDHVKFLKSSKGTWPVHVDKHRECAINIPIFNSENTVTEFYSGGTFVDTIEDSFGKDMFGLWKSNDYISYVINGVKEFEHILKVPTIINSSIPHGITNNDVNPRIICSWTYNGTYEEAVGELGV